MRDPLGGHGPAHEMWLWIVVAALFVAALAAAFLLYRRAARRAELEAIDALLDE